MSYALSGSIITQTGTDTSLAGLSAIAGMTTMNLLSGKKIIYIGPFRFVNNGVQFINPEREQFISTYVMPSTGQLPIFDQGASGVLTIGVDAGPTATKRKTQGVGISIIDDSNILGNQSNTGRFRFGGTFNLYGGIECYGGEIFFIAGSTINIQSGMIITTADPLNGSSNIRHQSTNSTINGLTTNYSILFATQPTIFKGLNPVGAGRAVVFYGNGTFGATNFSIQNIIKNDSTVNEIDFIDSPIGKSLNSLSGSSIRVKNWQGLGNPSRTAGYITTEQDTVFTIKTDGVNSSGIGYLKDTNNGQRKNQNGFNDTADKEYVWTSTTGITDSKTVILSIINKLPDGDTTIVPDYRFNTNDTATVTFLSYLGLLGQVSYTLRKDGNGLNEVASLAPDSNVTLTESNAITKLASSFTVNTSTHTITVTDNSTFDDLYDVMKVYKTRNISAQINYPTLTTQPIVAAGTTLNTAMNVVVASGKTLNKGTKFDTIITTGTFSGTTDGTIKDSAGVRCNISVVGGGAFNIKTSITGYTTNVTSYQIILPANTDFRYAVWSLGKEPRTRIINSGDTGGDFVIELNDISDRVDTSLDVSGFIANTTTTVDGSGYHIIWTGTNILNLEQTKSTTHRLMSYENYLDAMLTLGDDTIAQIFSEHIGINKPLFTLELDSGTQRTEINAYIDTDNAKAINPSYVLNPSNNVGLYVNYIGIPTAIDYAYMRDQVWTNPTRTLTETGLTEEEHNRLMNLSTGGGGYSSQAIQTSISNAKREIIEKIGEIPSVSLENIETQLNDIDSHIDVAKSDVIDTIKAIQDTDLSKVTESLGTLKQRFTKLDTWIKKKDDKEKSDELVEKEGEYSNLLSDIEKEYKTILSSKDEEIEALKKELEEESKKEEGYEAMVDVLEEEIKTAKEKEKENLIKTISNL